MNNNLIAFGLLESALYSYALYFMSDQVDWFSWYQPSPDGWGIGIGILSFLLFGTMLLLAKASIIKEKEASRKPLLTSGGGLICILFFLGYGDGVLLKVCFVGLGILVIVNLWMIGKYFAGKK